MGNRLEGPGLICPQCQNNGWSTRFAKFMCKITCFSDFRRPAVLVDGPSPWGLIGGGGSGKQAQRAPLPGVAVGCAGHKCVERAHADLPPASASSDMIRWSRVLLSHTLDAARSYGVLVVQGVLLSGLGYGAHCY